MQHLCFWHFLENHTPTAQAKWTARFPDFYDIIPKIWEVIYKMPYQLVKKDSDICDYCEQQDTIIHYFIGCINVRNLWLYFCNWWDSYGGRLGPFDTI